MAFRARIAVAWPLSLRKEEKQYAHQIDPSGFSKLNFYFGKQRARKNRIKYFKTLKRQSPFRFKLAISVNLATFKLPTKFSFHFFFVNGSIITQGQYSVKISNEKQQKLVNLWRQIYFIPELKHSKSSGQVIDDVMSLFWLLNKFLGRTLLSCKFHCFVMKRRLSIALGLVSRLFRSSSLLP